MQTKTIVWISIILLIVGLIIVGISIMTEKKQAGSENNNGGTGGDETANDADSFVDDNFVGENEEINLGDLV